ncbi:hypothetical protein GCM10011416_03080 [Polaribacter pacificus]|uniref:Por secretion system C-terminal sorting domain-containing protein n=1 Tax=Polaribacter pacificus TaxID=1775173 RepID=A0A917HVM4_9FLAO|nr:T9SS type A sorting domain-containing protein [Polaribacter pacificus]GGG89921.1 hypothetical protein GCM10011416_03080 [Polaribacter pacificus]
MKQLYFVKELVRLIPLLAALCSYSQSKGDIAFTAINVDGNDDFAIVLLSTFPANSILYFTDATWDNATLAFNEVGNDGFLEWNTGAEELPAGTIISFNNINNINADNFSVSAGTISSNNSISLVASGETIFAYTGTNKDSPTTFISGIKNASLQSNELLGTGLIAGQNFLELNPFVSPDGGEYTGSRSNQSDYASYLTLLVNKENWTINNSNGELFLDFSKEAFCISTIATSWTGSTNNQWNLSSNWSNGIPTKDADVTIPKTAILPLISTSATAGNISLEPGANITVSGLLSVKGRLLAQSGSTIMGSGTLNANFIYTRQLESDNWYLVASPFKDQTIEDLIHKNSFAAGTDTNIGLAHYENKDASWSYYNAKTVGKLLPAKGYAVKLTSAGNLKYSGSLETNDVAISLKDGTTNAYNLIGNPYTAFIPANTNTNVAENILTVNSDQLSEQTLWFWDQKSNAYITINQASLGKYIAPVQGFFVKTKTGGGILNFTKAMQQYQQTEVFYKSNEEPVWIQVKVANGDKSKTTEIFFIENTTTGFDNGYDSSSFKGVLSDFELYTRLVQDSNSTDLSIQSLPTDNYKNLVIPIGLKTEAASINFTAKSAQLPEDLIIYLEDRELGVFTKLSNDETGYTVTLSNPLDGIGRFYLHIKSSNVLSTVTIDRKYLRSYQKDKNTLRLEGFSANDISITLSNILGKRILRQRFSKSEYIEIDLPKHLNQGLYLISIQMGRNQYSKKIYINR